MDVVVHSSNDLIRSLSKYERGSIFSFDIFDTLVARMPGSPAALFACVEKRACREGLPAEGFCGKRLQAELTARVSGGEEITFNDIYSNLERHYSAEDTNRLKSIEMETELDLIVPIGAACEAIDWLLNCGETVVLASDMYHSRAFIKSVLSRNGIKGYSRLLLSSEVGKRKSTGALFEFLCEALDVSPKRVVHVGDNPISDVLIPRKLGLNALQVRGGSVVREPIALQRGRRKLFGAAKKNTQWDLMPSDDSCSLEKLGFNVLGPLLFGFSHWLHDEAQKRGIDKFLFMSRDGLLLKKAYEELFAGSNSVYVYGSRRSIIVPALWSDTSLVAILKSLPLGKTVTLDSFLERLGISAETVEDSILKFGYGPTTVLDVPTLCEDKNFAEFYASIEQAVAVNSRKEHNLYSRYIKSIVKPGEKCAFIDIGWNGFMQKAFSDILLAEVPGVEIDGFYTALRPQSPVIALERYPMNAFLFGRGHNEEASLRQELYNALYEVLFSADHGTVVSFGENELGAVEPILLENERDADQQRMVDVIQRSALDYVRKARARRLDLYKDYSPEILMGLLDRVGLRPTLLEAKELGGICIYEYGSRKLINRPPLASCLKDPSLIIKELATGYWKPGYLKVLLRLPVPYGSLLARLKQRRNGWRVKQRGASR